MRVFEEFPPEQECPICGTNEEGQSTLISVYGTNEDEGFTYEAKVFHIDCIDLMYYPEDGMKMIAQKVPPTERGS